MNKGLGASLVLERTTKNHASVHLPGLYGCDEMSIKPNEPNQVLLHDYVSRGFYSKKGPINLKIKKAVSHP